MRVLVAGGTGFIGSHLCQKLINNGHYVYAVSRRNKIEYPLQRDQEAFELINTDIANRSSATPLLPDVDFVFHLASKQPSNENTIEDYFKGNVKTTRTLLERYKNQKLNAFVYSSTIGILGGHEDEITEKSRIIYPIDEYCISKLWAEQIIRNYATKLKYPAVILRYSSVYGLGHSGGLVHYYYTQANEGNDIKLYSYGEVYRDIVHVSDVVQANIAMMEHANNMNGTEVFNIGSGESLKMIDIARQIRATVESQSELVPIPKETFNNSDVILDISKAIREIGYEPIGVTAGLSKYISEMEAHG
jgi:UDP-glucose 4-epimerase